MPAYDPMELQNLLAQALNAGNLDALVACYEPGASYIFEPGQIAAGTEAIQQVLISLLDMKPTLTVEVRELVRTDDIALTSAKWDLTGTGPDGGPVRLAGQSADVCRRQPDGTRRYIIDNPFGLQQ